ncbi:MAG TPA: pyridoxamine 5'-phosphate oxidase family protein [Dongiaceae bacterium]|nr:pyridoxamine 5'-phosphate oxidase family protein [Dongiaceae bacterium]
MNDTLAPEAEARQLMVNATRAYLGTLAERPAAAGGAAVFPFVSLVLPALDGQGRPLLLLSDLSDHARNLKRDPQASLLFDGTVGLAEPLTGPRLTLIGRAAPADDPDNRQRYVAAQPSAKGYAGFGDFHLYRFEIAEGLLVAGFGRIHRLAGGVLAAAPA